MLLLAVAAGASLALPVGESTSSDADWAEMVLAVVAPLLVVAVLVNLLVVLWSMRRVGGTGSSGRAGLVPGATFDDLIGLDVVVDRLREPVRRLGEPQPSEPGGSRSRGALIIGAPGTGKSMAARAAAGEAGATFLELRCADLAPRRIVEQVAALRAVFEEARGQAPTVVFLHEVHAIAARESATEAAGSDRRRLVRQLVAELDAAAKRPELLVIGSTSRPELLDPVIRTTGRLDDAIRVEPPHRAARTELLRYHATEVRLAEDVDLSEVAARTPGCIGRDLEAVVAASVELAARDGRDEITRRDLAVAVDRILLGTDASTRLLSREDKERLAFHQAGHALVSHLLPGVAAVERVTILDPGSAEAAVSVPHEPDHVLSRAEMVDGVVALLAGRCAEMHIFGDSSTTAEQDIAHATELARAMITRFGMDEHLGPIRLVDGGHDPELIERRVGELLARAERDALELLATYSTTVQHLALALLVHETIDHRAFRSIVGDLPHWGPTIDLRTTEGSDRIDRSAPRFSP